MCLRCINTAIRWLWCHPTLFFQLQRQSYVWLQRDAPERYDRVKIWYPSVRLRCFPSEHMWDTHKKTGCHPWFLSGMFTRWDWRSHSQVGREFQTRLCLCVPPACENRLKSYWPVQSGMCWTLSLEEGKPDGLSHLIKKRLRRYFVLYVGAGHKGVCVGHRWNFKNFYFFCLLFFLHITSANSGLWKTSDLMYFIHTNSSVRLYLALALGCSQLNASFLPMNFWDHSLVFLFFF